MKPTVKVTKGSGGWGGPLIVQETETRKVVASITGGGIHPLAQKIADLLHVPAKDGFREKVAPDTMIVAVVDCGGTLRCGLYPKYGVKTVDIHPISPSGPLSQYIREDNFVSGVTEKDVSVVDAEGIDVPPKAAPQSEAVPPMAAVPAENPVQTQAPKPHENGMVHAITVSGRAIGNVVSVFYQAGRDSVDVIIKNILPFMAFVSVIVGIINYTGIGNILANAIKPLAGSLPGLLGISIFCTIPFLSPLLGPGAVIAQIIGVLLGVQIGQKVIPVSMALPALFAINGQVGCDFIPVGLGLSEAEPETVEVGVPAILFTRLITAPVAVLVAFFLSFGLYS